MTFFEQQSYSTSQSEVSVLLERAEAARYTGQAKQTTCYSHLRQFVRSYLDSKWAGLSLITLIGLAVILVPWPYQIHSSGKPLLAIFLATIGGILLQPLPPAAIVIIALSVANVTKALDFKEAFEAFGNGVPWLVMSSLWIASGVQKSKLGQRLGYFIVSKFGGSPIGLVYGLVACEAILSPAIPSVAARAGGIILPVLTSVAEACGSYATDESANLIGAYLILTINFTAAVTSTMTLTGNHPNMLTTQLTTETIGEHVRWHVWALGAIVPCAVSLAVLPLVVYALHPPKLTCTVCASHKAAECLRGMGSMTAQEVVVLVVMVCTVGVWVTSETTGIPIAIGALCGASALVLSDVLTWDDCVSNKQAWSTYTWFAGIIALAGALTDTGVTGPAFVDWLTNLLYKYTGNTPWPHKFTVVVILYYYMHYFFAGNAAHVSALFPAFLQISAAVGAPPFFAAMVLSYTSNIMGPVTTYGMSHCPMFFETGYVPIGKWLSISFVVGVVNVVVWVVVGGGWWRYLEFYNY